MRIKLKYILCIIIGIILYYIVNSLCQCNVDRFMISGGKGRGGTGSKLADEGITKCKSSLWDTNYKDYAMFLSEMEFKRIENNLCKNLQIDKFDLDVLNKGYIESSIEMIKEELNLLYYGQADNSEKLKKSIEYIEKNFEIDSILETHYVGDLTDAVEGILELQRKYESFVDELDSTYNLSTLTIIHSKLSKYYVSKDFHTGLAFGRRPDTINITITILDDIDPLFKYLMLETNRLVRIVGGESIINIEGKKANVPFHVIIKGDIRLWIPSADVQQDGGGLRAQEAREEERLDLEYESHDKVIGAYILKSVDFLELGIEEMWIEITDTLRKEAVINLFRERSDTMGLSEAEIKSINAVLQGEVELYKTHDEWFKKIPIRVRIVTERDIFKITSSDLPHSSTKEMLSALLPYQLWNRARRDIDLDTLRPDQRAAFPTLSDDALVDFLYDHEIKEVKHIETMPRMIRPLRNQPPWRADRQRIVDIEAYKYYGERILELENIAIPEGQRGYSLLYIDQTLKQRDDIDFPDIRLVMLYEIYWKIYTEIVNRIRELQEILLLLEITKTIIDESYTIPKVTYNVMGMERFELNYIIKSEELIDIIKEKIDIYHWTPYTESDYEPIERVFQRYLKEESKDTVEITGQRMIDFKSMIQYEGLYENIKKVRRTSHAKWEFLETDDSKEINIMYSYPIPRFDETLPTESIYFPLKLGYKNRDRMVYIGNILWPDNNFRQLSPIEIHFSLKDRIEELQKEERDKESEKIRRIGRILSVVNSDPTNDVEIKAMVRIEELIAEQSYDIDDLDEGFTKEDIEQLYDSAENGERISILIMNLITRKKEDDLYGLGSIIYVEKLMSLGDSQEEAREKTKRIIEVKQKKKKYI